LHLPLNNFLVNEKGELSFMGWLYLICLFEVGISTLILFNICCLDQRISNSVNLFIALSRDVFDKILQF
jgi:hypothetical protein